MYENLRRPHTDLASLSLRLGLAAIFLAHGYIKLHQLMNDIQWTDQISLNMQRVVSVTEFACGVLLAVGLLSRLASLALIGVMVGAVSLFTGHQDFVPPYIGLHGFNFKSYGYEYNVLIIIACVALFALGSGRFSIDSLIFSRRKRPAVSLPPVGESAAKTAPEPVAPTTP
jgi:putative oxidoreductase